MNTKIRVGNMLIIWRIVISILVATVGLAMGFTMRMTASAETANHFLSNGLVTFSPDRTAFTIGYGDKSTEIYSYDKLGYKCIVNGVWGEPETDKGYHIYTGKVVGETAVGYWRLSFVIGRCIHSRYSDYRISALDKMGSNNSNCYNFYNAGWIAYCACCDKPITPVLFYMTERMAGQVAYLPSGTSFSNYFYLCPYDNSLENYYSTDHNCSLVSANKYKIVYNAGDSRATGSMKSEWFYTDCVTEYEGEAVEMSEQIAACGYSVKGMEFVGWSDSPKGEVIISDEEEWISVQAKLQVLEKDNETSIVLYAVWNKETDNDELLDDEEEKIIEVNENDELQLNCYITRNLLLNDGVEEFKWGESGRLYIRTEGEADYVTVEFPNVLDDYDCQFDYRNVHENVKEEVIDFSLPITVLDPSIERLYVKVTAYKEGIVVTDYPMMIVISESILENLRTSLR